jgi:hypothetical protein
MATKRATKKKPDQRPAAEVASDRILVLRTCAKDLTSYNGSFRWPASGPVEAPDWRPEKVCGRGLHGLLWGEGEGGQLDWSEDAKWLVVEVARTSIVDLDGKVKFPRGEVVFCGDRKGATEYVQARRPGAAVCGAAATAGVRGTATAGYAGTATAGVRGTATAGYAGTATAGYAGTATAGVRGTATAGVRGTATAGDAGTATAGDAGTATAGYAGTATAGDAGTATAGDAGILVLRWWDGKRYRVATFYVGEDGIEAGQPYKLDEHGKPVKVEKPATERAA